MRTISCNVKIEMSPLYYWIKMSVVTQEGRFGEILRKTFRCSNLKEKWKKKEWESVLLILLMRKLKLNEVQWCIYSKSQSRKCLKKDGRKPSSSGVLWVQRKMVITMGEDLLGNPLDSPAGCFAWTLQRSSSWKSPWPTMWLLIIFSVIILSWIFHESRNFSHSWPWRNVFC